MSACSCLRDLWSSGLAPSLRTTCSPQPQNPARGEGALDRAHAAAVRSLHKYGADWYLGSLHACDECLCLIVVTTLSIIYTDTLNEADVEQI